MKLCPMCHKADAVSTEFRAVTPSVGMAVSLTVPEKLCGRCGLAVADIALRAAQVKHGEARDK